MGTLTDLKVCLREKRPSTASNGAAGMELDRASAGIGMGMGVDTVYGAVMLEQSAPVVAEGLGKNEGTVRFVWGDDVVAGA
jgi:hypothetical protein